MSTAPLKQFKDFDEDEHLEYYHSVNACPHIDVAAEDSIEVSGYSLRVHKDGKASRIKGKITFTPWQWRQLIRQMVEDGDDIEDWSAVDLSWVAED